MKLHVDGIEQLRKALYALPQKVQRKFLRQAMNKGATPMVKAAKANAPIDSGLMKEAIGKVTRTTKSGGVTVRIGAVTSKEHWQQVNLVEYGTIHQAAQPFLRPAFDSTVEEATKIIKDDLGTKIEAEARRLANGG